MLANKTMLGWDCWTNGKCCSPFLHCFFKYLLSCTVRLHLPNFWNLVTEIYYFDFRRIGQIGSARMLTNSEVFFLPFRKLLGWKVWKWKPKQFGWLLIVFQYHIQYKLAQAKLISLSPQPTILSTAKLARKSATSIYRSRYWALALAFFSFLY